VVTSLEWDHPDLFPSFDLLQQRFKRLVAELPAEGLLVVNADDRQALALTSLAPCRVITFSVNGEEANYQARRIQFDSHQTRFEWWRNGEQIGEMVTGLAGIHNVANALSALAAIEQLDIPTTALAQGLASFRGAKRRFDVVGTVNDVTIIDDYAHHPTEVAATLAAARLRYPQARLWAFFAPHTYSRTAALLPEFATAFAAADVVLLSEVEAARETSQANKVSIADVAAQLPRHASQVHYVVDPPRAKKLLLDNLAPGDVVVCMSVSGAHQLAQSIVDGLRQQWAID
jgi:UDP-N-acetylmuramate--alanine ligase